MKVTNLGDTPIHVKIGDDPRDPPVAGKGDSQIIKPGETKDIQKDAPQSPAAGQGGKVSR